MIEERARVVEVDNQHVWVETQRQSSCGGCNASQGCGSAMLAKIFRSPPLRVRAVTEFSVQVGDEVVIGIEETALLRGSLAVYVVPLLIMFLGAVCGELLGNSEQFTVAFGLLGLMAGFAWLRSFTRISQIDTRFQPMILRCLPPLRNGSSST